MNTNDLRIGFDATPIVPGRSGIGIYCENLIQGILKVENAPQVTLFSNKPLDLTKISATTNLKAHYHKLIPTRALWMQTYLPWLLKNGNFDLCHFPNYLTPLFIKCPMVVTFHDMALFRYPEYFNWKKRIISQPLIPAIGKKAAAIIAVSHFTKKEIINVLGIPANKIHVIYEAPAPIFRRIRDQTKIDQIKQKYALNDHFILAVGTFEPRKNLLRLIHAFHELYKNSGKQKKLQLVFVGARGWKYSHILKAIRPLIKERAILELGYVPQEDLATIYSIASIVTYLSLYEGFGLPILEAMACGTPVLTSKRTSTIEIAGSAAYFAEPDDTQSIYQSLKHLLNQKQLSEDMASKGLEHVKQFSWKQAAQETIDLYHHVVQTKKVTYQEKTIPQPHLNPSTYKLSEAILSTISYADLFQYPLTLSELHRDLIAYQASLEEVQECVQKTEWLREQIDFKQGYFFLKNKEQFIVRREKNARETDRFIQKNIEFVKMLSKLPYLKFLAFSGGTSFKNSIKKEDIDLFMITAPGFAWFTFTLGVLLSYLFKKRSIICMNYIIDETELEITTNQGDFFTAHQLIHLKPLINPSMYGKLLNKNAWIFSIFPNAKDPSNEYMEPNAQGRWWFQKIIELILWPFAWFLERFCRILLKRRFQKKKTATQHNMRLTNTILKLHVHDNRQNVTNRFLDRLKENSSWQPHFSKWLSPDVTDDIRASQAWDAVAGDYDQHEDQNKVLHHLRQNFQKRLSRLMEPAQKLLELGSGTGRDTIWLWEQGAEITAIDISEQMLEIVKSKKENSSQNDHALETLCLSLNKLDTLLPHRQQYYDGIVSNFGVINCITDLEKATKSLAQLTRPNGWIIISVMNSTCLWEWIYYLLRLQPKQAFRRIGKGIKKVKVGNEHLNIRYFSPSQIQQVFLPDFDVISVHGNSIIVPPPYLNHLTERYPTITNLLFKVAPILDAQRWLAGFGDHFVMHLKKK